MTPSILTIIVTYNAMPWAKRCFDSLKMSSVKPDVFVIDNGSNDGTQEYIQSYYPYVILNQSKENLGFGKANNLGLQYAIDKGYNYVYLLNQDAWVMSDTFEKLISISRNNTEYGILSPFQMNSDMFHIDQAFICNSCSWKSNKDIFNDLFNHKIKEVYPVERELMAAHWFMTRDCILKVGGFSPSFPHYGEDDNYADRVRFWNLKLGIVPSLRVVHDRGERVVTKKMRIYQSFVDALKVWSSPYASDKDRLKYTWYNIKLSVKYKSWKPLLNFLRVVGSLWTLKKNKNTSMKQQCAFLSFK